MNEKIRDHRSSDWQSYTMVYAEPHQELEPVRREVLVVEQALRSLRQAGILPHIIYDREKMLAHRQAVRELFEIPWTAITPRLQRLLYAINAIHQPANLLAAGIFCGNTFISNAGAAIGPGSCYRANRLVGVEIKPEEAERAARNVARIDTLGEAQILAADAVQVARDWEGPIDLLYLDADGQGKRVYLDILEAAYPKLSPGALILAHNSINAAERLSEYLAFVRDESKCQASVNIMIDGEGLEVSCR